MPDERDSLDPVQEEKVSEIEIEISKPKTAKEREAEKARQLAELEEERKRKKEEAKRQKELANRRVKRRLITPGVMLSIGLIVAVTMYLKHFETNRMLAWLLVILIISCIVGRLIQYMFERFAKQNDEIVSDEGEVIHKGSVSNDDVNGEANG